MPVSSGDRHRIDPGREGSDWFVVDATPGETLSVSYDGSGSAGTTALFLYGPDGGLQERVAAEGDTQERLQGIADTSGPHFVQAVGHGQDTGGAVTVQSGGQRRSFSTLASTTADQSPYDGTRQQIPGTIQAERFDEGGEGVAYHDTTEANRGGAFRTEEAVDIASADDASGEYNVGYFKSGEWLEYTVDVDPGTYTLQARVAGLHGGEFEVSLDGESLATVSVPETGGWQTWQTVSVDGVDVSQDGTAVLRIDVLDDGFNLNWLEFSSDADESYGKLGYGDAGYGGS